MSGVAIKGTYIFWVLILVCSSLFAQQQPGAPLDLPGEKQQDSLQFDKSNTDEWHNDNVIVKVRYKYLNSNKVYTPDSSIHTFHRRPYSQPWYKDLGNLGTATQNLMFTPEDRFGPTLGYNALDIYRIKPDSLRFYNTTAPYSVFSFNLGSKLEQKLQVLHTQNIKPNWNFAFEYDRVSSQGFFLLQRTAHDMGSFSTNYQSVNQRYKLKAGFVYNKCQQDENGGITIPAQLTDDNYNERSNLDIAYANAVSGSGSSVPRSLVTNVVRDYNILLEHGYSWGRTDTLYNEDSTNMSLEFTPRFSISHHFRLSNQQYNYKDMAPDSLRYAPVFAQNFLEAGSDSVYTRQKQNTIDNAVMLNGFLGKNEKQVQFSAGLGIRVDKFSTRYLHDAEFLNIASNYITAQIRKEALSQGQWFYTAEGKFYLTGAAAGNSLLHISLGKELGDGVAVIDAGIQQNINNPAYNYTSYINNYYAVSNTFNKESVTKLYGGVRSDKYHFNFGAKNYLISNYLYMNANQLADQYAPVINLTQLSIQKSFTWKGIVLDNELLYQTFTADAPINVPMFLGRHQLSYEHYILKNALKIATGVEMRYHSPYQTARYSPIFHRFYYGYTYMLSNDPVYAFFFNFNIKRFRSFIMVDQLQQVFRVQNVINLPGYPAQNTMIRFGFNWVLLK